MWPMWSGWRLQICLEGWGVVGWQLVALGRSVLVWSCVWVGCLSVQLSLEGGDELLALGRSESIGYG